MLFPEQCRKAVNLQRKGLLLKEIARELDVSFEDVALYLFGGIADWSPIAPARDDEEDFYDDLDAQVLRSAPVRLGEPGANHAPEAEAEPEPVPEPPPPPPPPLVVEPETVAPLYRLTNEIGEYLDKSGVGMTRRREKAWQGTAQQMEVIFKSRRHLQNLDPERVLP